MNELGEGDIDIIKAPIVIDNVSDHSNNLKSYSYKRDPDK